MDHTATTTVLRPRSPPPWRRPWGPRYRWWCQSQPSSCCVSIGGTSPAPGSTCCFWPVPSCTFFIGTGDMDPGPERSSTRGHAHTLPTPRPWRPDRCAEACAPTRRRRSQPCASGPGLRHACHRGLDAQSRTCRPALLVLQRWMPHEVSGEPAEVPGARCGRPARAGRGGGPSARSYSRGRGRHGLHLPDAPGDPPGPSRQLPQVRHDAGARAAQRG